MGSVNLGRIFMFALFVFPSPYVVVALGGSASPAMILGLVFFGLWLFTRITRSLSAAHTRQPIHIALGLLTISILASTAAAYARILPPDEALAPIRGIAITVSWLGVCLFFADGLRTRSDVEKVVSAFVIGGSFVALIGLLQFATGEAIATSFKFPGLGAMNDFQFIHQRNGLPRVSGTAYHPIEYAVILSMIWPFALRHAVMGWSKHARISRILPLILITCALPTALSRTTIVAMAAVMLCLWGMWSARRRLRIILTAALGLCSLFALAPDIPRVLIELFTKANEDVSISTRTEDYANVSQYIRDHALFGQGYKTFDPARYFFLDNQILLSLIETGIIGTLCLFGLMFTSITLSRNVRHTARDPYVKELGQCCVAALFAVMVCFVTFDTFSFPMVTYTTLSVIGIGGALWRINRQENGDASMEFSHVSSRVVRDEVPSATV